MMSEKGSKMDILLSIVFKIFKNSLLSHKTVFTLWEAALYIGMKKSYLYRLTADRQIPFYKPNGKMLYFKREELDHWLTRNRVDPIYELESEAARRIFLKDSIGV